MVTSFIKLFRLGRLLYVFALLQAVITFKPFTVEVMFLFTTVFTGKYLLIKGVDLYENASDVTAQSKKGYPFKLMGNYIIVNFVM